MRKRPHLGLSCQNRVVLLWRIDVMYSCLLCEIIQLGELRSYIFTSFQWLASFRIL